MSMFIGLMSGTSMDGVDGVLTSIPDNYVAGSLTLLSAVHMPFPTSLRADLMALQTPGTNEVEREALASNNLAHFYAECVIQLLSKANVANEDIEAIGVHGQTIRHRPELGYTRQANNPALLAELSGINVVSDFRSRDIAAGGQGAPLVPAFHQAVFGKSGETRVLINLGGISNISILQEDGGVQGFDTGPGNVLLDAWIKQHRGDNYDADGMWAAQGRVMPELLDSLLNEPYFAMQPPKSTGRDLFNPDWLKQQLQHVAGSDGYQPEDVQATLTALTARTVARAIVLHAPKAQVAYVCGGGAYNGHLVNQISQALLGLDLAVPVMRSSELGVSPDHVEALAFAWLAYCFCRRHPANLPSVTGANGRRILGALYPA